MALLRRASPRPRASPPRRGVPPRSSSALRCAHRRCHECCSGGRRDTCGGVGHGALEAVKRMVLFLSQGGRGGHRGWLGFTSQHFYLPTVVYVSSRYHSVGSRVVDANVQPLLLPQSGARVTPLCHEQSAKQLIEFHSFYSRVEFIHANSTLNK